MNPVTWAAGHIVRVFGYAIIGLGAIIDEHRERRLVEQGRKLASQREDLIALGIHPDRLDKPNWPGTNAPLQPKNPRDTDG